MVITITLLNVFITNVEFLEVDVACCWLGFVEYLSRSGKSIGYSRHQPLAYNLDEENTPNLHITSHYHILLYTIDSG